MKFLIIFAAVVVVLGLVFISSSMRAMRRERNDSQTDSDEGEYASEVAVVDAQTGTPEASPRTDEDLDNSRYSEGDLAYREALRMQLRGVDNTGAMGASKPKKEILSDVEYRKALRGVISDKGRTKGEDETE
ncbi:hypothetical protein NZD89_04785 [Alicyclobacillus fastidiosus]|uniref:SHOCT domain-containing protein n=1 Tax=Alicyclobacillus fastidiosus TaxID=392011 RepID=A0ABY6ZIU2_9BACL|nr:hypothetical protein [Alicyclobacillus fastidiosus]WAH42751.1 hypothetical protein NZD89_04785 [Alicyclobacillus fastidiosus]GMA64662.1 hypothetical protein GCM10025859_51020 [Alicyclobacillus fastidiosus]